MLLLLVQFSHHLYPKIFFAIIVTSSVSQSTIFVMVVTSPIPEDSYCLWHNLQHLYPNFIFGTTVTKPVPQYSVLCNCYMTWTTSISLYPQHIRHNLSVFNFGMVNICFSKLTKQMSAVYGWQTYSSAAAVTIKASGVWNGKTIGQYMCTSQKHSFSILRM